MCHFLWLRRHPTSCCSVAEIMSVLFFHNMKYRYDDPRNFNNDRFIMSKVRAITSIYIFLKSLCYSEFDFFSFALVKDCMNFGWFLLGTCCSSPVLHVGWSRIPEGERDVHFVPCRLLHGGTPNPCKPSHIPHLESPNVAQTVDSNNT